MSFLRRLDAALTGAQAGALAAAVLALALVNIAAVVARSLGHSLTFAEEANQALMVAITFLGIGYAARQARHVRMTALLERLGPGPRRIAEWGVALATAALLSGLALLAAAYVGSVRQSGRVSPALGVSLWWVYALAPLGLALGAAGFVLHPLLSGRERSRS